MTIIDTLMQSKTLYSTVFSGKTEIPDTFGFRGNLVLKEAEKFADEARPPEVFADQVIISSTGDKITFFACHVDSLAHLAEVYAMLKPYLLESGKYFIFAGNVDISEKYFITYEGIGFYILPLDEATVWNEMLECFSLDRGDIKRLSSGGKVDALAAAASSFSDKFKAITFEEGLAAMGPVRIPENRPV